MYRSLDPTKIVDTARTLGQRIDERFPGSGLSRVAAELVAVSEEAAGVSSWLARPHLPLRVLVWLGILLIVVVLITALRTVLATAHAGPAFSSLADMFQGLDAAVNEVILTGVAIFFLCTLETRFKRSRALQAIHVLRCLAHIIDMHQLTKDPERVCRTEPHADTPSSPRLTLTPLELTRYLDYCSELLALISKISAVYVQRFSDPVTLTAVNEMEDLTSGLSRKIWQKIMILDRIAQPGGNSRSAVPAPASAAPS